MLDSPESKFAIAAVREACTVIRAVQTNLCTAALTKSDKSPVTVADFAAQAAVARRFALERPSDVLVGEEDAKDLRSAESRPTLDNVTVSSSSTNGLYATIGTATIQNSTFTGNVGAGIALTMVSGTSTSGTLTNTTLSGNGGRGLNVTAGASASPGTRRPPR